MFGVPCETQSTLTRSLFLNVLLNFSGHLRFSCHYRGTISAHLCLSCSVVIWFYVFIDAWTKWMNEWSHGSSKTAVFHRISNSLLSHSSKRLYKYKYKSAAKTLHSCWRNGMEFVKVQRFFHGTRPREPSLWYVTIIPFASTIEAPALIQ